MDHQTAKQHRKQSASKPYGFVDTWVTAETGGRVLRPRSHVFYRVTCRDCEGLVLVVRPRSSGRWPGRCPDCSKVAEQAHSANARFRVARVRKERRPQLERNRQIAEANRSPAYLRWLERKKQPGYYDT